jgi:hypothetical protein
MSGVTVQVLLQDIKKVDAESLVVGFFQDVRPLKGAAGQLDWVLCGALSSLLLKSKLRGAIGDVALLTSGGKVPSQKIFLVGLGTKAGFSISSLRAAVKTAIACVSGAGVTNVAIEYFQVPGVLSPEGAAPAFREGLVEGAGGRALKIFLIAPDEVIYTQLSRLNMV